MKKYLNKYRIPSHRKPDWNYSENGMYFITLVTNNRDCCLGQIINKEMLLSDLGEIVNDEWLKSIELRQEIIIDEFTIMPNHLHAIIVINQNEINGVGTIDGRSFNFAKPITPPKNISPNCVRLPKSLSSFIGGFKSSVNTQIDNYIDDHNFKIPKYNKNNHFFQPNYHDHIIRNEQEYIKIKNYIIQNPLKWKDDLLSDFE